MQRFTDWYFAVNIIESPLRMLVTWVGIAAVNVVLFLLFSGLAAEVDRMRSYAPM